MECYSGQNISGQWRVEGVNKINGEVYQALFMGPNAAKMAWSYVESLSSWIRAGVYGTS